MEALRARRLSKRYGDTWALRDCTLNIPPGRVAALVGPNGAGKTTLLHLAVGLIAPTAGDVEVFGWSPRRQPTVVLARVGFLAQDRPLYRFTVEEMLALGRRLNPRWDDALARRRLSAVGVPLHRRTDKLSGGQQSQVALALALAKRPELLLLDEPAASLDPLARREFMEGLMEAVAEGGLTVVFSSHVLADLERVCDYLVILSAAHVQLAGDTDEMVARHKLLTGPRCDGESVGKVHSVVQALHTDRQTTLLVRTNGHIYDPSWTVSDVLLEDVVLAYLRAPGVHALPEPQVVSDSEWIP
ncbi:MAG: ABC transporter ATP-binding protein [Candidatus Dormibacter sp.]|uniref:ABC transporter ATP-binding protein n=1 Tax=Candidatus Dormibacter sp. TaxID=2973982 RepID=UPI000DB0A620|nr:MAG: ABC transporter ATP-binding protein [Candidatus Dormibacteraeota bacterium]